MTDGLLLGLAAAVSFGSSDALAAIMARRVGTLRAAAGALLASLVSLAAMLGVLQPPAPASREWLPPVLALGALAGVGYLALVNALRLGPVSAVSPLTATGGAVSVLLAVVLLQERPTPVQWLAVGLAATGAALVAVVPGIGRVRLAGPGPAFALMAVACYAISLVELQQFVRAAGVLPVVFIWRVGNVAVASLAFAAGRWRRTTPTSAFVGGRGAAVSGVFLVGLLETSGQTFRALGLAVAPAWLLGLVGSLAPAVVVAAGVAFLGERPRRLQWAGMSLVGLALALLAVP